MYIVTGGAGFIGSRMVAKLNQNGIKDITIVDTLGNDEKWTNLKGLHFDEFIHVDKFLTSSVLNEKISAIIHLGACSSTTERNVDYLMENNYQYTKFLAKLAVSKSIRFLFASSGATYGDGSVGYSDSEDRISKLSPLNAYGYSKNVFDQWASEKKLFQKMVGLRFFNVYGPNEYHKGAQSSVVLKAFKWIKDSGKVTLFRSDHEDYVDGGQMRDFIYVEDCVDVMWWLINNPKKNGLFNLGTGKARSWNELALAVFAALGVPPHIEYIPMPPELQGKYQNFTEADMAKFHALGCPVKFHTLEEGVKDYVVNFLAPARLAGRL